MHGFKAHKAAAVTSDFGGPENLHRGKILICQPATLWKRDAERRELLARPADANTEDQPTSAELVEVGDQPCRMQWVAIGHNQHGGAEFKCRHLGRKPSQGEQGIVEGRGIQLLDVRGRDYMVRNHHQMIARRCTELGPVQQGCRASARPKIQDVDANFHTFVFLAVDCLIRDNRLVLTL
jgi:hypothetical protein